MEFICQIFKTSDENKIAFSKFPKIKSNNIFIGMSCGGGFLKPTLQS